MGAAAAPALAGGAAARRPFPHAGQLRAGHAGRRPMSTAEETHARKEARALIHRNVERIRRMEKWSKRSRNFPERVAEVVARFCGRMTFVWIHAVFFAG